MRIGMPAGLLAAGLALAPAADAAAGEALGVRIGVAADRDDWRHRDRDRGPDYAWQRGHERGRDDGWSRGARDARRHRGFDLWRHSRFRDADAGYKSRFGPRRAYSRGYRQGFAEAYQRAFAREHRGRDRCYDSRGSRGRWRD